MSGHQTKSLIAGVIGLGAMGHQMAKHMAAKGVQVIGYDVLKAANDAAATEGVRIVPDIAALGREVDVAHVIVQTDAQVLEVIHDHGLLAAMRPGSVICIASSVTPEVCKTLEAEAAERGVGVLDTTLILGQRAANEGRLTIFVGGKAETLAKARAHLECFGRNIHHLGPSGAGQVGKTCNNMLLWACICANYEALSLARKMELDIPKLIAALADSSGANNSLSRWGQSTGKWAEKDMDVALEMAQAAKLPMPLAALVDQLMKGMDNAKMRSLLE